MYEKYIQYKKGANLILKCNIRLRKAQRLHEAFQYQMLA